MTDPSPHPVAVRPARPLAAGPVGRALPGIAAFVFAVTAGLALPMSLPAQEPVDEPTLAAPLAAEPTDPAAVDPAIVPVTVATTIDTRELDELDLGTEEGSLPLELDSAIAIALERNLGLAVERYQRTQSLLRVLEATGIYDLDLFAQLNHSDDREPVTSTLEEVEEDVLTLESTSFVTQVEQLFPWGGLGTAGISGGRSSTNNQRAIFDPAYDAGLELSYTQPLLRNFGRLATERNIILARLAGAQSRDDFEAEVELVIQQVNDAYWGLVEAQRQLLVAQESLELAQELHEMNRIQVEVGTMAPLELVQSEAGVATRQEDIIRRRATVEDQADVIRQLLNFDVGPLWDRALEPVTEAAMPFVEIDVPAAVATALAERPDVRRQRLELERLAVDAEFFENQERPRLDLSGGYGLSGTNGEVVRGSDGEPEVIVGDFYDAFDDLVGFETRGWNVQLTFAYPLQNRAARARSAIADLAVDQGEARLAQLEQQVLTEVRRTARAVRTAEQQIESARVSSRLAERNLDAEQRRYENGLSTSFQVLEIQEDLTLARSREVSAITAYRRALVDYQRSIGRLVEASGFALADPEEERDYSDLARRD